MNTYRMHMFLSEDLLIRDEITVLHVLSSISQRNEVGIFKICLSRI
jgi:hypothetical protein